MCLTTRRILPNVTLRDKVVYKILRKWEDGLYTPFQYHEIKCRGIKADGDRIISRHCWGLRRTVSEGYVHAYKKLEDAQRVIKTWQYKPENNIIVKCVIPAGTLYFNSFDRVEICAKQMIISEQQWNALNNKNNENESEENLSE